MFTHLHLHTEYSLLDGACKIEPLMARLKALGMDSCAITDHGVMYGVVDFYRAAIGAGIHPIIGCEVYVCQDMDEKQSLAREFSHLVLLCENNTGYKNLSKLVSEGFLRGFYYKPRVDFALLEKHAEGLIALSACLSGDIPKLLLDGRENDARGMAERYRSIFGKDNFFIEIQDHGLVEQKRVLPGLVRLAREMDIPLVATNDCHYLESADASAQEVLMCVQTGKTLLDENRMKMETDQLYVKGEDEMRALFPNLPDAIDNTAKIAARCRVEFDFSTTHLPKFPLPKNEPDAARYLEKLCRKGLAERYGEEREDARARLAYELDVICSMGYVDYFLIVWDFIRYAKENGIGVGPGRGSGAGSIVAYSLGITAVDPIEYQLLFERFLNPERISMPDIDVDFDYERRGEVIAYVRRRYGSDHVAQIITFGTMAARASIRDVGRVLGLSFQQTDQIAKLVPFELGMTLERALSLSGELRRLYENDEQVKSLIDTARKLEGMPRNASTHAAGVLITSAPVCEYVPLQTNDDVVTTQFPMGTLEALGLLKMDFLGLRTLNVINDTIDLAIEGGAAPFTAAEIPLDDAGVYKMISAGDTDGLFQLESTGMRNFLTNMRPESFEDIIAAISLYRPGPMESIPRYIEGKHNPETVRYEAPQLKPILDVTYGCMVYQEQVMQIVRDLAGYSMGRSDLVRRAMSKKKHDVMMREKQNFIYGLESEGIPGAVKNGVPEKAAEKIFDEMTAFASYAFNKSHAAAYGVIAVQTGYLKLHYPVEFMAALMNSVVGNASKIAFYIQTCKKGCIEVLPPDVNRSQEKFSVDGGKIRFGLAAIKNLGHGAIQVLIDERASGGPFRDIYDFCARVVGNAVNKKAVESLIRSGALDALPGNRAQKLGVFERAMDAASKAQKTLAAGQLSLFDTAEIEAPPPPLPDFRPFSLADTLQMEKEVTGIYISGHPLDAYEGALSKLSVNARFLASLAEEGPEAGLAYDQRPVRMGGIVTERKLKATKSGNMMAFVQLEDMYGVTEVLVFPKVFERYGSVLEKDAAVLLSGKLSVREEEEPKLLLDRAEPLAASAPAPHCAPQKKLYLKLSEDRRAEALEILAGTPGEIPVVLVDAQTRRGQQAPERYWVGEGYDASALANLLGGANVVYK